MQRGSHFSAGVSAAISHEIKNTLAIVNENAGLLADYSALAAKGVAIDPGRLKHLAEIIQKQIGRCDRIVKQMNRFAHSADEPVKRIDLAEMLALIVFLADRSARLKGVGVAMQVPAVPVAVVTSPFVLENLIMRCLDFGMAAVDHGKKLKLSAETTGNGALIRFAGIGETAGEGLPPFPSAIDGALARQLTAALRLDRGAGEMVLVLPKDIHSKKGEK